MQPDSKSLKYLQESLNVSRETLARLQIFVDVLLEWQKAINLISPATVPDLWWRHIVDSAQLLPLLPAHTQTALDIGSGAGFPALVLAILTQDRLNWMLIESDRRKGIFLREAARRTGLINVTIVTGRIEDLPVRPVDLVTARALAPLDQLLRWSTPFARCALLPKGAQAKEEIAKLDASAYKIDIFQSVTDETASVLRIDSL